MKFKIAYEARGRLRIQVLQKRMTLEQADLLEAYLSSWPGAHQAVVHERTCCAIIQYRGDRAGLLAFLSRFSFSSPEVANLAPVHSSRALNRTYEEKLVGKILFKGLRKLFLPPPLAMVYTMRKSIPYLVRATRCLVRGKLHVELLDGLSISLSMVRRDFSTAAEGRASRLADKLVPYTLLGSGLAYLRTRNVTRALSVLMVDFSCALKLAMPLAVLSAMREASGSHVTVKGGKFLEAVAQADTMIFDKTGTLTRACPTVVQVIPFGGRQESDMLRLAACLEEHFPHSMANAVVQAAREQGLSHEEMHSQVDYLVAHGIASTVGQERVVIGGAHFVFEDEGCAIPPQEQDTFDRLPNQYTHLYLAIVGVLAAVICISDPLRPEAKAMIQALRSLGIRKTVMLTGDSERTAAAIAALVGVDDYRSEVLPEDKASYIAQEHAQGRTVIMLGDGINDSPALSAADVGIAISDGAAIAREVADITISADSLSELVTLRQISTALMKRIQANYRFVIGFNGALIGLGAAGVLAPATSAMLHNLSTLGVSLRSMTNLLEHDQGAKELPELIRP